MANTQAFLDHVLDLVSPVGPVEARRLFGGHGLFVGDAMFALVDEDELFLKTDETTLGRFVEAGCRRWTFARRDGSLQDTSYFQPPDDAHEEPEAMLPWARLAVEVALRKRAAARDAKERAAVARRAKARARGRRPGEDRGAGVRPGAKVGTRRAGRTRPRLR